MTSNAPQGPAGHQAADMTQTGTPTTASSPSRWIAATTNVVTAIRRPETDGYNASRSGSARSRAARSRSRSPDSSPRRASPLAATSWRSAPRTPPARGRQEITVEEFACGRDAVDVTATSKGKGFAGTMKRHGFSGVGASTARTATTASRAPSEPARDARPCLQWAPGCPAGWARETVTTEPHGARRVDAERGLVLVKGAPSRSPRRRRRGAHLRQEGGHPMSKVDVTLPAEIFDAKTNVVADPPGGRGPAGRRPPGHARHQDPRQTSAAVAASRTARRAPAAPARARPVRPSSPAAARSTARSRVTTASAPEEDEGRRACAVPSPTGPATAASTSSTAS